MPFLDTDVITQFVNEYFDKQPSIAKGLLRMYTKLIKGATLISGHIVTMDDIYPMIDKLEQAIERELTDKQVEKIEQATEKMLDTDDEKLEYITEMINYDNDDSDDITSQFIKRNTYGG